jgi:ankyrin repeat protein
LGESEFDEDNLPDLDDLISVCAGLVTVTADASSDIVRLVHYTTQEYFERTWARWFLDAHSSIATTCVTYLSFNVFQADICPSDTAFEARLDKYPLYSYAARNWGHHARTQPISEDLIMAFLEDTCKVDACVQATFARKGFSSHGDYSQLVPQGFTGLHLAAYFGLENTAWSLIQSYNQSSVTDSWGRTPLTWAAYTGHDAVVKLLLDNGVDAHTKDGEGQTPMTLAASMGWVGVVKLLLEHHIDPDSKDIAGQPPLIWAAYRGHEEVVQLLLEKGANPGSKDDDGQTPLSWAASNGWVGIVQLLLQRSVELDSKDVHGRTPLSWAAENGHAPVVELLLEKGAQPDSRDAGGHTPLFWATYYAEGPVPLFWTGHEAVVRLLQERCARLASSILAIHDFGMQNTPEQVPQNDPGRSSHPLALKHKVAPSQEPTRQLRFKCPLCLSEQAWKSNNIGVLKRHIVNQRYHQTRYYCPEPQCVERKRFFLRLDMARTHFESAHKRKLSHENISQIRQEEPHPQCCPVCQTFVDSWEEFHKCVISHARVPSPSIETPHASGPDEVGNKMEKVSVQEGVS